MPAWERVKATKTPTVYRGIRLVTLPPKTTTSTAATAARTTMPLVKARRSPRKANWLGRNWSRAIRLARRGKSAKAVFAARISSTVVANCTR